MKIPLTCGKSARAVGAGRGWSGWVVIRSGFEAPSVIADLDDVAEVQPRGDVLARRSLETAGYVDQCPRSGTSTQNGVPVISFLNTESVASFARERHVFQIDSNYGEQRD
jgi:hypothetical protein